jgi:segregation and condensation protein B
LLESGAGEMTPDEEAQNRAILEALLIAADDVLGIGTLTSVIQGSGPRDVRRYVDTLNEEYLQAGRSFKISEVAGGFQFMVHPDYAPWLSRLFREKVPMRLSQAALETLAIVAFKQPVTKAEVEQIRGVTVDGVLRLLLERGFLRISGRAEGAGRPLLYGTTRGFLKHFGLNTLSDLPKLIELEELLKDAESEAAGSTAGVEAVGSTGTPERSA